MTRVDAVGQLQSAQRGGREDRKSGDVEIVKVREERVKIELNNETFFVSWSSRGIKEKVQI